MKLPRRGFLHLAAGAAALPAVSRIASAQAYPSRPITMVVPFAAGGPTDVVARIVGERMGSSLRQTVVIENVTGADGVIGVGRVARARPDGYTLSVGQLGSHVLNGAVYSLPYDLLKDFEPISLLSSNPYILITNRDVPANNLKELIDWLRKNQDKASMGIASMTQRVSGVYFQKITGTHFLFVPYRGAGPALQDLVAGQIDMLFDQPSNTLSHLRAGNTKAFAVAANTRLAAAPDIPTIDEAGLPGFYVYAWNAVWTPKGTPMAIVAKLNSAVAEALADPIVRSHLTELGQEIPRREQQSADALARLQRAEIEKWWPIIREANIKGE
jgi:tripartite-type tricarboxylate transporter receptor subunit TctC